MNIHVANLSLNVIDSDLRKLFAAFGEVDSAVIVRDKLNGRSRGTAIVDMVNDAHGLAAIQALHRSELDGRTINVSEIPYSIRDYKN
jgi:RNA recognition motif-containing protein